MKFTAKSEEQIAKEEQERSFLWGDGLYGFEIMPSITFGQNTKPTCDTISKNGNEMIHLAVRVVNHEGRVQNISDYLTEAMSYKLRHAAYACGLGAKYESGELMATDFIGKSGTLELISQKGQLKDESNPNGERYPDRNVIKDYCVADDQKPAKKVASVELDDEIPF